MLAMANSCKQFFYFKCEHNRMCNRFNTYETHLKKKKTLVILLLLTISIIQTKSKIVVECSEIVLNGFKIEQSTEVYSPKNMELPTNIENMDYFYKEKQNRREPNNGIPESKGYLKNVQTDFSGYSHADNLELSVEDTVKSKIDEFGKSSLLLENNDFRETHSMDIFPTDSEEESDMEKVYFKKDTYESSPPTIDNQKQNNQSKVLKLISILPILGNTSNDTKIDPSRLAAQNNTEEILDTEKPQGFNTVMKQVLENQGINGKEDISQLIRTTVESNQKNNVSESNIDKHHLGEELEEIMQTEQLKTKENDSSFVDKTLENVSPLDTQVNDDLAKHTIRKNELDNQEISNGEYITTTHSLSPKELENENLFTTTENSDQTNSTSENDKFEQDEKLKKNIEPKPKYYFEENTQDLEKADDPYIIEHTEMKKLLEDEENFYDEFITTPQSLLQKNEENENELIRTTKKLDQKSKDNNIVNYDLDGKLKINLELDLQNRHNSANPTNDINDRNKELPYDMDTENSPDIEESVYTTELYNSLFVSSEIKHLLVDNNSTKSQNLSERLINSKHNLNLLPQIQNTTNSTTAATNCSSYFNICFQDDQITMIKDLLNTTSNAEDTLEENVSTEMYKELVESYENIDPKSNSENINERNGFHSYEEIPEEYHRNISRNNSSNSSKETEQINLINVNKKTDTIMNDNTENHNLNVTANYFPNVTEHANITQNYESTTIFINKETSDMSSISVETQQNTLLPFDDTDVDVTKNYENKNKFISKDTSQMPNISEKTQQVTLLPFDEIAADVTENYESTTTFIIEEISQLTNISYETQQVTQLPFDNIAATLFEHFSPRDAGQTLNDNLADEVAGIGKALPVSVTNPSNRSTLIIIFSSGIAFLFIVVSVTIFLISFQRQHGTLDIEKQERNCGKDDLDIEDAQTLTKLLDVKLSPIINILDESEECL